MLTKEDLVAVHEIAAINTCIEVAEFVVRRRPRGVQRLEETRVVRRAWSAARRVLRQDLAAAVARRERNNA